MMILVDVHCHLESPELAGDLSGHIAEGEKAGVRAFITAAVEPGEWPLSLELAGRYPSVHCALGIHPWYAREEHLERIPELRRAHDLGVVAIGEIGLDRKIEFPSFELQTLIFEEQMRIAADINMPVVVHCRGAFNELIASVKKTGMPARGGVIHAFSGSPELAVELMKLNFSFSMGGALTYRASGKRRRVLELIYPGRFMLETDAPDIPPVQKPDKPNLPANILYNLRGAADLLNLPPETIAETTTENARRLFGLGVL